ncbi:CPBP family intramembrane metalloprotease [Bizionia gelidisalsuginis]|uniref:CPBP family intramembrane metalloprotease n=2 Tax=Bizionia TaxID=283785 RepID=A0A8H2LI51_9FLAO|nr:MULTISPECIES: CPBP family glutamic-type intramembrane protease [Bizionia]TYB76769.1 CPBP family intramembrane metalloprotease [Bizionia saleffrena]TYC12001.1 CPBP family intramembrane metalloprotease [Bizionia gelidisalsuginis]
MTILLKTITSYLKNPTCNALELSITEKLKLVLKTLVLAFAISFFLSILISILENFSVFSMDQHATTELFKDYSPPVILLLVAIVAPVLEELLFRAPITLFCKNKTFFKTAFYAFTLLFGFIHIFNYDLTLKILIFSPILVAPQLVLGVLLGFLRVKIGLVYAMVLHALFNASLIIPSLLFLES